MVYVLVTLWKAIKFKNRCLRIYKWVGTMPWPRSPVAYDNSIRYTDNFLARLIRMLQEQDIDTAMLYTSDHGEDIFDDDRHLFLHASPVPSYYQIHVPFLVWMSDNYRKNYPDLFKNAEINRQKNISSSASFFQTMLELGGIDTPHRNDSFPVINS